MNKLVRELLNTPNLSMREERGLFKKIKSKKDVENSIDRIYRSYYKFGYKVARKRFLKEASCFEDVMSDISLNIIKAIKKFDNSRKAKFSSYCYFWINAAIIRSFDETQLKFSGKDKEEFLKIGKLEVGEEGDEYYAQAYKNRIPLSLDFTREKFGGDGYLLELEPTVSGKQLESCYEEEIRSALYSAFQGLEEKEKEIFKLRNGLDDSMQTVYSKKTCEEVGEMNNVTKQAVSAYEKKINEKIRSHINPHKLGSFL